MPQPATLLKLPACERSDEKNDVFQTTAPVETQSREDDRLAAHVERALHASGYQSLRAVVVSVNARVAVLLGRVPSYFLKQMAQSTALAVPGVHQIDNGLDVVPPKRHAREEWQTEFDG
ncbi:MAG: BON domain-containing protein, partial [Deltaproteobacteria bacterium]